jgi:hypothetical protein
MPKNRLLAALAAALFLPLFALAQQAPAPAPATATPAPPTEAELLLDAAIAKLKALNSISAKILERVEMLGQKFRLEGTYLKDSGYKVYLSLKLYGLGDTSGVMLQVCDGATLWDFQKVLDAPSCRKLSIGPILKKLESPDADAEIRDGIYARLGFSGPETLLTGLRKSIQFNQKEEGTFEGKPVWILRGRWKDRDALNAPGQPQVSPTGPLPPHVPSQAAVYLGKDDGWPYQVVLEGRALSLMERKKDERPVGPDGRPIGRMPSARDDEPSRIVLTYSDVALNPKLEDAMFSFTVPSDITPQDGTEQLTTMLDNALNQRAAQKKADAAKGAGAELPQSIAVPKPASDAPANPPELEPLKGTGKPKS